MIYHLAENLTGDQRAQAYDTTAYNSGNRVHITGHRALSSSTATPSCYKRPGAHPTSFIRWNSLSQSNVSPFPRDENDNFAIPHHLYFIPQHQIPPKPRRSIARPGWTRSGQVDYVNKVNGCSNPPIILVVSIRIGIGFSASIR